MKVTMLGSGSAYGTPMIFNSWRLANPENPRNVRKRASLLLEKDGKTILIDAGPDVRNQINEYKVANLDAVFLTHGHFDHIGGVPELPRACRILEHNIEVWASAETRKELEANYSYLFKGEEPEALGLVWKNLPNEGNFEACGIQFFTFQVPHHQLHCSAFRCGDFAYVTDWQDMPVSAIKALQGVKLLVIECNNGIYHEKNGHGDIEQIREIVALTKIEKVVLSHLSARVDYDIMSKAVEGDGWTVGYDGLVLEI